MTGGAVPDRAGGAARIGLLIALVLATVVPVVFGDAPQDDAYISYRYARHYANGDGLVFNAGEPPVEGYTNFLWTWAIGLGMRVGLDPETAVPWVGLAFTLLTVVLTYGLGRRLGATSGFAALGALLFASRPMLAVHAMGGLETSFFGALVALALWLRWRDRRDDGHSGDPGSAGVFGLAALTRPEGVLVFGLVELFELLPALRRPASIPVHVGRAILRGWPFAVLVVAHVAWRRATYGDWVPNTFHAKVEPGWTTWKDGLAYVGVGLWHLGPLFVLAPFVVGAPPAADASARHARRTALFVGVVYALYVVYAGGDYIPSYRFLWPIVPLWCALAAAAATRVSTGREGAIRPALRAGVAAGFVALIALHTTIEYRTGHRWAGMDERHRQLVAAGRRMDEVLPADAWIAVTNAGRIPYFAERPTLDMMGLADAHIARRSSMQATPELAGHLKGDGEYVLDRAPEVITFLRLVLMDRPLAREPDWLALARQRAFGVSEREIAASPRFPDEYRVVSIPLALDETESSVWLNLFARDGVFDAGLPDGTLVAPRRPS